jgi:hypothetical protein
MAEGTILIDIHSRLIGLDAQGNIVLLTSGLVAEDAKRVGPPHITGKGIPTTFAISNGVGASSNISNVTFQMADCTGASVAGIFNFDLWLSDAATGIGLTATTASGGVAAATGGGTVIGVGTTSKMVRAQTNASGAFVLAITDTAKTAFYPCASFANLVAVVGAQLATASYHS